MRSNHVGVNNVQAQTHNKLDDCIDMMSKQQLIEENAVILTVVKKTKLRKQALLPLNSISLEAEH